MHLKRMEAKVEPMQPPPAPRRMGGPRQHEPRFDLRGQLYRITGVDLTQIEGVDVQTAQAVISKVGVDMRRWKSEKQFAFWLRLCLDNRMSGGQVLKGGTQHVVNRASTAWRVAAWGLLRSQSALGAKFRRLRSRLGVPQAITAMAHLLARVIYRMLKFGVEYVDKGMEHYETKSRHQQLPWVAKHAAALNMQLIPVVGVAG